MTPETGREAECWIKLSLLTVLSVPEILRLLQQTGGVEALFDASSGTLTKLAGETAAREIREVNSSGEAERILSWLSETKGVGFITLADPRYPRLMIEAPRPCFSGTAVTRAFSPSPCLRWAAARTPTGRLCTMRRFSARRSEPATSFCSRRGTFPERRRCFSQACSAQAAGRSSGSPADRVWPSEGRDLLHELLDKGGLIMTAVAPGFGFSPEGRELQTCCRMASAQALLALNAGTGSHLFSLARTAADWGRDVMAVPGSIHSPFARGCHRLIRQGARLVESSDDILAELRLAGS